MTCNSLKADRREVDMDTGANHSSFSISIFEGKITKLNCDVMINSSTPDLNLRAGKVSSDILQAASPSLQDECKKKYPRGIKPGEIAQTKGYNVCEEIYHVNICNNFNSDSKQLLKTITTQCLEKASDSGYSFIAFPALGTGFLGYPPHEVADAMLEAMFSFKKNGRNNKLSEVVIVIHDNRPVLEAFQKELDARLKFSFHENSYEEPKKAPDNVTFEREESDHVSSFIISIIEADISQQNVDVIVNDTSNNLDLRASSISAAILQLGGPGLQEECRDKYPNGIGVKDIARTWGYNLNCKEVYHVTLCKDFKLQSQRTLREIITKCLLAASEDFYVSIAFPAFGIDSCGYPRAEVANVMIKTILQFQKKSQQSSLREVLVVVSPQSKALSTFQTALFENQPRTEVKTSHGVVPQDLGAAPVSFNSSTLPPHWTSQSLQENVKMVPLSTDSDEYQKVTTNFRNSLAKRYEFTIVRVSRVQNPLLLKQYQIKKTQMEIVNGDGKANEKLLWHGTASASIPSICHYGFNRSYCGKNLTLYGKGVYFALNSELSTRDIYSPPDPSSQERNVFQCRVLVGHPVVGSERLNVLPTRQGHILYDSATDDMRNPSLYVIFHDSQAYPEYIITFRSTGT